MVEEAEGEARVPRLRFRLQRIYRHGVLELIWPKLRSSFDSIVLAEMAGNLCVVYGAVSLVFLTLYGKTATAIVLAGFFALAGFDLAARRWQALLLVYTFLLLTGGFWIIAFGPTFTFYCLVAGAVPLFGAWRALGRETPLVSSRTFFERLRSVALAVGTVSAIIAVSMGTVFSSLDIRPSDESMLPTIAAWDHLLGIGRPWAGPITRGELWETSGYGAARIIGLPGDDIQIRIGKLILNGVPIDEPYSSVYTDWHGDFPLPAEAYGESWRSYHEYVFGDKMTGETVYRVPADHYLMLNDNRKELLDSRLIGPISKDHLVARLIIAFRINRNLLVEPRLLH